MEQIPKLWSKFSQIWSAMKRNKSIKDVEVGFEDIRIIKKFAK